MTSMNCTLDSSGKRRHIRHGPRNVLGIHGGLDRSRAVCLQHALAHVGRHFGGRVADINLAAGNVVLPAVERCRFREAGNGVLGCRVGGGIGPRAVRSGRPVVDDTPALRVLILHDLEGLLCAKKRTGNIGIDHGPPVLILLLLQQHTLAAKAGIIEQQVEPTERLFRLRKERGDRLRFSDVRRHSDHLSICVGPLHCRHGRFQAFQSPASKDQRESILRKRNRDALADAAPCSGDECNLRCHHFPPFTLGPIWGPRAASGISPRL